MSFSEFWNIAGRAGRAMRDRVGLVVFPITNRQQEADVRQFLRASAAQVASALIETLTDMVTAAERFDLGFVRSHKTFAVFLQYLTHALRIGGAEVAGAQLQDLLRSSLVYFQLESTSRRAADDLVRATTRYLESIAGTDRGWLALADRTGSACLRLATSAPYRPNASCISSVPPPGPTTRSSAPIRSR